MESIINGVAYNIVTAFEIAQFIDGRRPSDPLHMSETLCRQRRQWFLRRRRDGVASIVPLTPEQTREWCEQKRFDWVLARWFSERVKRTPASVL